MKYLKTYKIYEGVWNDIISEIDKKRKEIIYLRKSYFEAVNNCMYDITDNWDVTYAGYPRDIGNDDNYGEFEICYEVKVKLDDVNNFLERLNDANNIIKSYIEDKYITIESVWSEKMDGYNSWDEALSNYAVEFPEVDLEKKKAIMEEFLLKELPLKKRKSDDVVSFTITIY